MKAQLSLLSIAILASSAYGLEAIDDAFLSNVTGQAGITIEQQSLDNQGQMVSTGEIRVTEKDNDGQGKDYLAIDGLTVWAFNGRDASGMRTGATRLKTIIDVDENGSVHIRNEGLKFMDMELGAISMSGRTLFGGIRMSTWESVGNSRSETEIRNDNGTTKIISRSIMEAGSGYTQTILEDDVMYASDTVYIPTTGTDPIHGTAAFLSESIITGDSDGLRIEFGETKGTMEMRNLRILNQDGSNAFGEGVYFGDLGYGDITVNPGSYMLIKGSQDDTRDGMEGEIRSDINIGSVYYRTGGTNGVGGNRINLQNVSLKTNNELKYQLDMKDYGHATGMEMSITDLDVSLAIGGLTITSDADAANPNNKSLGSIALDNIKLSDGGSIDLGIYTLAGVGAQGLRQDVTINGSLGLTLNVYDDDSLETVNPAKISADIVINNFAQAQTTDYTKKGINIITVSNSMDMNVNALRMGNGQTYQGQSGRLVMNNIQTAPGSFTRIEPIH
ncbi:MAG: DUF6160 family protein [Venatoribacter sp.]